MKETCVEPVSIHYALISLCLNLVVNGSISFRAVPKVLESLNQLFSQLAMPIKFMIPCVNTVINWTLRTGLYLLNQLFKPSLEPYVCIIYHTIQVGSNKASAVLKVPLDRLGSHGSLSLDQVEVLYLKVQETSNGILIENLLMNVFQTVGYPAQVVMDGGADLNKGMRLISEKRETPFKVTYDVTH